MSGPVTVKDAVKGSFLGTEEPTELSSKTKAAFVSSATKDPESGELYMSQEQFINAIAPADEDYVRKALSAHDVKVEYCF